MYQQKCQVMEQLVTKHIPTIPVLFVGQAGAIRVALSRAFDKLFILKSEGLTIMDRHRVKRKKVDRKKQGKFCMVNLTE